MGIVANLRNGCSDVDIADMNFVPNTRFLRIMNANLRTDVTSYDSISVLLNDLLDEVLEVSVMEPTF